MPFNIFPFVYSTIKLDVFGKLLRHEYSELSKFVEIIRGFECGYNDSRIGIGQYKLIKAEAIGPYFISKNNLIKCDPDFSNTTKYKTHDIFCKTPKLVTKFCANKINFAIDNIGYCNTNSVYNCKLTELGINNMYYLLAILNSKLTSFWFNTAFMNIDALFPHIQKNQLETIPIPFASKNVISILSDRAEKIIKSNQITAKSLEEIDHIVYHLYDLTYDEVLVVDPETPITREEYESFKLEDCDK